VNRRRRPTIPVHLLALDPGAELTGWVLLDTDTEAVLASGKSPNDAVLAMVRWPGSGHDAVVIESMTGRSGQPFGGSVIETLVWTGRFVQADLEAGGCAHRIKRDDVKRQLLGSSWNKGKADPRVRLALIDRYAEAAGRPGGGKAAAVGLKASPGPLYGIHADAWAALAAGLAWVELERERLAAAGLTAGRVA
jgi:hypothetical protein